MKAEVPLPWPLLLSKLREARRAVVAREDLVAAGLDPEGLFQARVIERFDNAQWRVPGCERLCLPNLDRDTRRHVSLVGVACPHDPPCWEGWQWVTRESMEVYVCSAEHVFAALREPNDLLPLDTDLSPPFVPVGTLQRRGRRVPVVWTLNPREPFEEICRGLRHRLGGDGLFILVSHLAGRPVGTRLPEDVVLLDIPCNAGGDLALWRGLDVLDPQYRTTWVRDPGAILDGVVMEFATIPRERHVVRINGQDFGGFQKSDLKFLRLLYLAAARAADRDVEVGGWLDKWCLQGDDRDHDIEALRKELRQHNHPDLSPAERSALIKRSRDRDGRVRLGVHPRRIRFDDSLAGFVFLGETQQGSSKTRTRSTPGATKLEENRRHGLDVAKKLLADARRLGVLPLPRDPGTGE